jgi:hypothetical protein
MTSRISYDDALTISLKGKYFPQPTNHAGLPVHPVFCDYCGRSGLGGSWKYQDTPQWDLCMQCYVALQSSNITSSEYTPKNTNQDFHNNFANNTNNINKSIRLQSMQQSTQQSTQSLIEENSLYHDNYHSAWASDVPGSYSNRIITSKDGWHP